MKHSGLASRGWAHTRLLTFSIIVFVACATFFLSLPRIIVWEQDNSSGLGATEPFPVGVNPKDKTISENAAASSILSHQGFSLSAAAGLTGGLFESFATAMVSLPWYQSVASLAGVDARSVTIHPGYRKEQVANVFGETFGWSGKEKKTFLTGIHEGTLSPGTYVVGNNATPAQIQGVITDRFNTEILAHYATSTADLVPLTEALTIASMIERETSDKEEMRVISGIIWNRLFHNMKLQIDATVQYTKALAKSGKTGWWPTVEPRDTALASPYNTYQHEGLPPTPIANPSVAAVLAALNPKQTDCLFYFHDDSGDLHCSPTYAEHVALLKQYFGRGK